MNRTTHFDGLSIHIGAVLGNCFGDIDLFELTNALSSVRLISAGSGISDLLISENICGGCLALLDYLCCIGNDNRTLTGIGRHVEIKQRYVICIVLSVVCPFDRISHIVCQLHLLAIADFDHDIALQGLKISHDVSDMDTAHLCLDIADCQSVRNLRTGSPLAVFGLVAGFGLGDFVMRFFFVCNGCLLGIGCIVLMLLRSICNICRIIDTAVLCGFRINQFHRIGNRYRTFTRCSLRECVVIQRCHAFAVVCICCTAGKIDLLCRTVGGDCHLALRDHNICHVVGEMESRQFCCLTAVGNCVGHDITRQIGCGADCLYNRHRLVRFFEFNFSMSARNIFLSVHFPGCRVRLSCLVFGHLSELLFRHCCFISNSVVALCHTRCMQCRRDIKREVLSALRNSHRRAVDFDTVRIKRLQSAECIVECQ